MHLLGGTQAFETAEKQTPRIYFLDVNMNMLYLKKKINKNALKQCTYQYTVV